MINFLNVTKKYANGHVAVNNLSFQIEPGEMVFLQGHSGAGKSTLLKMIACLEEPTRGQILISGKNIQQIKKNKIPYYRRRLGFISQDSKLLNNYTLFENVAMPLVIAGYDGHETARRVRAALDRVGLLEKENYKPLMLSIGEQQRVGIARAVVHKPRILLADEPTGNLDPELSIEIMKLFERFHQSGVTVLIASHDVYLIHRFPQHRKLNLYKGELMVRDNKPLPTSKEKIYE